MDLSLVFVLSALFLVFKWYDKRMAAICIRKREPRLERSEQLKPALQSGSHTRAPANTSEPAARESAQERQEAANAPNGKYELIIQ